MADKMLIIHGYSDGSTSFTGLRDFFAPSVTKSKTNMYSRVEIFFVDYSSMDDDATMWDFADKLNDDYNKIFKGERIDVACHSTGALVARAWLALRRKRQIENKESIDCPVEHLLMFAPANFGSDLAKLGQSFLGKISTTFFNNNSKKGNFLESGKNVLQALEPASPFQWELSNQDLYDLDYFSPKTAKKDNSLVCYPFVFAAGNTYTGVRAIFLKKCRKPGTDGTVRISGTSLNTRRCKLIFPKDKEPSLKWQPEKKFPNIPFCVFDGFNHSTMISNSREFKRKNGPGELAKKAIQVKSLKDYEKAAKTFSKTSAINYSGMDEDHQPKFQQFFFKVTDDTGFKVEDYYLDFYVTDSKGNLDETLTQSFDENFESEFYTHSEDPTFRVMLANHQKLGPFLEELKQRRKRLVLDITAKPPVSDITYVSKPYTIADYSKGLASPQTKVSFLHPNTTTFIEIILDRNQSSAILNLKNHALKRIKTKK